MTISIFEACELWPDISSGKTWRFTADVPSWDPPNDSAAREDILNFLERTYPTARLRELIRIVFGHIGGSSGNGGCVVCLHAPPGGGKTHALRMLTSFARVPRIDCLREFIAADVMPREPVRLSVIDGEKCDLQHGMQLEADLQAYTPWGQLAYHLAGRSGIARIKRWDRERIAPPSGLVREIIDAGPALIVLDRMAGLWRRFDQAASSGHSEMPSFISALTASVASSRQAALVCTLATRNDPRQDPYHFEHSRMIELLHDSTVYCFPKGVAPERRLEMAFAFRRFLFKRALSEPETYPVDGATFDQLVSIVRACDHTHVFGGTLAVLGRSCHNLWKCPSGDLHSIQAGRLDLRPLAERVAYDRWESNGRPPDSAQTDIEYAKRFLQAITSLADRIVI
jgi:hypothetical protein